MQGHPGPTRGQLLINSQQPPNVAKMPRLGHIYEVTGALVYISILLKKTDFFSQSASLFAYAFRDALMYQVAQKCSKAIKFGRKNP